MQKHLRSEKDLRTWNNTPAMQNPYGHMAT